VGHLYGKRFGSKKSLSHTEGGDGVVAGILHTYSPMKMEQAESSETLAFNLQKPRNNPEDSIRYLNPAEV
jgi:hypothetical protein